MNDGPQLPPDERVLRRSDFGDALDHQEAELREEQRNQQQQRDAEERARRWEHDNVHGMVADFVARASQLRPSGQCRLSIGRNDRRGNWVETATQSAWVVSFNKSQADQLGDTGAPIWKHYFVLEDSTIWSAAHVHVFAGPTWSARPPVTPGSIAKCTTPSPDSPGLGEGWKAALMQLYRAIVESSAR